MSASKSASKSAPNSSTKQGSKLAAAPQLFADSEQPEKSFKPPPPPPSPPRQPASGVATPMMAQYLGIKHQYQNALLFYRMGDFYELFFDDAKTASAALDIALTKRGKHLGEDIAMCGVPVHAAENYILKLIRAGHRIAVCEQVEAAAQKTKSGQLMKREVVRLITPGTIIEDSLLKARAHNYLLALAPPSKKNTAYGLAWADISTGDFRASAVMAGDVAAMIARIAPKEILLPENSFALLLEEIRGQIEAASLVEISPSGFEKKSAARRLDASLGRAASSSLSSLAPEALSAAGALLDYVQITQIAEGVNLKIPIIEKTESFMMIDAAARINLELTRSYNGGAENSLLAAMDRTLTGPGGRLMASRLNMPLLSPKAINARLDEVEWFLKHDSFCQALRENLRHLPDMFRALSRLSFGRAAPRDLSSVRDGLDIVKKISAQISENIFDAPFPKNLSAAAQSLKKLGSHLSSKLNSALVDDMPVLLRSGNVIRPGYDSVLDSHRESMNEHRRKIAALQLDYAHQTGIKSLKVRFNNMLGHYIETPSSIGAKLLQAPLNQKFIHRQTLANVLRFSTEDLAQLASDELSSHSAAEAREKEIFDSLIAEILSEADAIRQTAHGLAVMDAAAALSIIAREYHYARPEIDDSCAFDIVQGRHPVVEASLAARADAPFIANDCRLSADQDHLWLITGPNMAGKSTFLRQNALIAIMAQMGSFVPAHSAHIGVIDRLFSRVGAADNLAAGQSTFMVEMVEAAVILAQASARSFVVIDEIGRGTSTFDGLALAWAIVEHIHNVTKCRALFATHFHELIQLEDQLPHMANRAMQAHETEKGIVFLHEIAPGGADRSYGVQVARLAGLPPKVLSRAAQLLKIFEKRAQQSGGGSVSEDMIAPEQEVQKTQTEEMFESLDPDALSPREALDMIYRLKQAYENDLLN